MRTAAFVGAILGGVVGAGMGVFINESLCKAEDNGGPCPGTIVGLAGLGALAGALVGAGVDAATSRGEPLDARP